MLGIRTASFAALVLAPMLALAGDVGEATPPKLKAGDDAPAFGPMKVLNAQDAGMPNFVLGRFAGESPETPAKGVLVSFFATWCGPCKKELPFLASLDAKYRAKGLQLVSISIDREEAAIAQAKELVAAAGVKFPVVSDRLNLLARRYLGEKTAMPSIFLVKPDGTVALVKQGYDGDASAFLISEVEKLIGG